MLIFMFHLLQGLLQKLYLLYIYALVIQIFILCHQKCIVLSEISYKVNYPPFC